MSFGFYRTRKRMKRMARYISRESLEMHLIVMGETGAGKKSNGVLIPSVKPLAEAASDFKEDSILLINLRKTLPFLPPPPQSDGKEPKGDDK